jgi:two-component system, sensor histidine kinase and response regulator
MPEEPPARILIVDDEAPQMKALSETLKEHGYETVGFTSAGSALAALENSSFDLLLSDLTMPEMDGITLLKSALQLDPDLGGIIMTGQGTIDTAVEAMKSGAVDYILKPFKVSVILPVLSRALAIRKLRFQNAELQKRLQERTEALEAANAELDSFASSVAHDLHAPTRHIAAYSQILMDSGAEKLAPQDLDYLRTIIKSAERMGALISDLLSFSRLSHSAMHQRFVDLNALVAQVREELKAEIAGREIIWKKAALPTVRADESMLRQVMHNLLSNAVKYTRDRHPAEIEIGSQNSEADKITVYVRDNGAGFEMKYAEKLFGVFQRLHPSSQFEGIGIGLANVRRIIERHGGQVRGEGEVGKGATFYFTLPRTP